MYKTSLMKCSIADAGLRNISWVLLFSYDSSSEVHPAETRNSPPSSRDDTTLLDQCIPAMGHPGLINPGHGGSLPSGGSGRQNVALTAQKLPQDQIHHYPPAPQYLLVGNHLRRASVLPLTTLTDKLHPGKSPENEHRHQMRALFAGVLPTAANHEVFVVSTG